MNTNKRETALKAISNLKIKLQEAKTKSEGWKMGKKEREIIKQFETMKSEIMGKITVLKELPMEFAAEAKELLNISLEGSVG